jgi:hypothetical protein
VETASGDGSGNREWRKGVETWSGDRGVEIGECKQGVEKESGYRGVETREF